MPLTRKIQRRLSLPSAPQNLRYTATTESVTVEWDAVEGATSYKVYRGAEKVFYKEVTDTSCTLTGISPNTKLTVNVTAVNEVGESPMSQIETYTEPDTSGS
ncbi:fibronectin type III domain-containing protein [Bacillus paralicheniformis]|nr:fibronectin type III domain-containing protein [Bacillus paralicheniformis]WHX85777.1 fibronectin type III domain-containing protein [Bacillus paralicheniformis]